MAEEDNAPEMTAGAKALIAAVLSCGVAVLGAEFLHATWPSPAKFLCYLVLVALASRMRVVLPGIYGTMSVNLVVILVSLLELSLPETLVMGCVAAIVQTWRQKRMNLVHLAFNTADIAISVELSYYFFRSSASWIGPHVAARLVITAVLYFVANTLPIAAIVALTEKRVFHKTWAECYFWSFPNYLVGGAIAWLISWSNASLGWQASLLMLPILYLIYRSYCLYLGKLDDEKKHVERIAELHLRTIEALALAIDAKDHTTHDHLKRVRVYAEGIGREMGLSDVEMEALRAAALLHDIGKLAVPEHIINKPGRLTPEEFEKMKIHPIVGAEILERVNFPYPVVPVVRSHHERWDGSGYPDGLKGEEIPIGGRILAVVDCLDAISSDRHYRRGLPLKDSVAEIVQQSGRHFDPRVVDVLQRRYADWEAEASSVAAVQPQLSTDIKVANGGAPAAGFETTQPGAARELDALASIVAARYEAQALLEFSNDLGRSLGLEETLSVVAARLRKLIPYDALAIYRAYQETLSAQYATGDDYRALATLRIPLGEGVSGWVAANRKAIINGNPAVEPGYLLAGRHADGPMSSALAVPLVGGDDRLLGVLTLYKQQPDAFSNDHLRILLAISDKIAASIENAAKYQDAADWAHVDHLTGLPNARSLFQHLDAEISRCGREGARLAVIFCDLDGFKQVNDRYGHMAGNQLLQSFAVRLRSACRLYDYVSRMGGDEFVVIAPGLKRGDVQKMNGRLAAAAAGCAKDVCPGTELTVSAGIAFYPEDSCNAAQLLVEADKRMYAMKKEHHSTGVLLTVPSRSALAQSACQ
jgi:diguanylate cyclase (GGDEF)-like protein/putative nucleotidyltransferase with HDIG domain